MTSTTVTVGPMRGSIGSVMVLLIVSLTLLSGCSLVSCGYITYVDVDFDERAPNELASSIISFSADWVVPPAPLTSEGGLINLWTAMLPQTDCCILYPVLTWGNLNGVNQWFIASYYEDESVTPNYISNTTYLPVQPGDVLQAVITLLNPQSTTASYSYSCQFLGYPQTYLEVHNIALLTTPYIALYTDFTPPSASWYPSCASAFINIAIETDIPDIAYEYPVFSWTVVNVGTGLGEHSVVVNQGNAGGEVVIYYGTTQSICPVCSSAPPGTVVHIFTDNNNLAMIPYGVAVDIAGNMYVTDTENSRVVVLSPLGAQLYVFYNDNTFYYPKGIAVDASGNIYVVDSGNNRVVVMSPLGIQQNSFTNGFSSPTGLAVDSSGKIYVSDYSNNRVVVLSSSGVQVHSFNTGLLPDGLAVDVSGNIYVSTGSIVVKYSSTGTQLLSFGDDFISASGVALDVAGNVYIADIGNSRVVVMSPLGATMRSFTGYTPFGLAVDGSGSIYATNEYQVEVLAGLTCESIAQFQKETLYGFETPSVGSAGLSGSSFVNPDTTAGPGYTPFTFGPASGIGSQNGDWSTTTVAADEGQQFAYLQSLFGAASNISTQVTGLVIGNNYTLTFAYSNRNPSFATRAGNNGTIQGLSLVVVFDKKTLFSVTLQSDTQWFINVQHTFQYTGSSSVLMFTAMASKGDQTILIDGVLVSAFASPAGLLSPNGLFIDQYNNLWVADTGNNRILHLAPNGTVLHSYTGFDLPSDVWVDTIGLIYVANTYNNSIVVLYPTGQQKSVFNYASNGIYGPGSVAVDSATGLIYVTTEEYLLELRSDGSQVLRAQDAENTLGDITIDGHQNSLVIDDGGVIVFNEYGYRTRYYQLGLSHPMGVAVDTALDLYISDTGNNRVLVVTCNGAQVSVLTNGLNNPKGVALDNTGAIFVVDSSNNRIVKFPPGVVPDLLFGPTCDLSQNFPIINITLCIFQYSLPGSIDYPFSIAYSLQLTYNPIAMMNVGGHTAVAIISATGMRTFTNRFGISSSVEVMLAASSPALLYINSSIPLDPTGLELSTLSSALIQQPGAGPSQTVSTFILRNMSGVVMEASSYVMDPLGVAWRSSAVGFINQSISASNINSLAANYASCTAPISFSNGLRVPTQPSASNGATYFDYSYTIGDGVTYLIQANLTFTTTSAFATTQDALGNPYQTVTQITGIRHYTYLPTAQTLLSTVTGIADSGYGYQPSSRFYPYSLLASSPGIYSINTVPLFDGNGVVFTVNPPVPTNGETVGSYSSAYVQLLVTNPTPQVAVLSELNSATPPIVAVQQQRYHI